VRNVSTAWKDRGFGYGYNSTAGGRAFVATGCSGANSMENGVLVIENCSAHFTAGDGVYYPMATEGPEAIQIGSAAYTMRFRAVEVRNFSYFRDHLDVADASRAYLAPIQFAHVGTGGGTGSLLVSGLRAYVQSRHGGTGGAAPYTYTEQAPHVWGLTIAGAVTRVDLENVDIALTMAGSTTAAAFNHVGLCLYYGTIYGTARNLKVYTDDKDTTPRGVYVRRVGTGSSGLTITSKNMQFRDSTFNLTGASAVQYYMDNNDAAQKAFVKYDYVAGGYPSTTAAKGDITWHNAPAAGGIIGWVCTTAGTPGTWKSFGAISA
jgi:hypothetical protein